MNGFPLSFLPAAAAWVLLAGCSTAAGAKWRLTFEPANGGQVIDEWVRVTAGVTKLMVDGGLLVDVVGLKVENLTDQPLRIDWDAVSFVDVDGAAHRVIHKGVRFIRSDAPQTPTTIPPHTHIDEVVTPADNVLWTNGSWQVKPLVESGKLALDGKTFGLHLPVSRGEGRRDYAFQWRIRANISRRLDAPANGGNAGWAKHEPAARAAELCAFKPRKDAWECTNLEHFMVRTDTTQHVEGPVRLSFKERFHNQCLAGIDVAFESPVETTTVSWRSSRFVVNGKTVKLLKTNELTLHAGTPVSETVLPAREGCLVPKFPSEHGAGDEVELELTYATSGKNHVGTWSTKRGWLPADERTAMAALPTLATPTPPTEGHLLRPPPPLLGWTPLGAIIGFAASALAVTSTSAAFGYAMARSSNIPQQEIAQNAVCYAVCCALPLTWPLGLVGLVCPLMGLVPDVGGALAFAALYVRAANAQRAWEAHERELRAYNAYQRKLVTLGLDSQSRVEPAREIGEPL